MLKANFRPFVLVTFLLSATTALAQDYQGTSEQRAACTFDAFRLCASYIPDGTKVEACLRNQMPNLSARCRAVFSQNTDSMIVGTNR